MLKRPGSKYFIAESLYENMIQIKYMPYIFANLTLGQEMRIIIATLKTDVKNKFRCDKDKLPVISAGR